MTKPKVKALISVVQIEIEWGEWSCDLPKGAHVLSVGERHGEPVMWLAVDTSQKLEPKHFFTARNGEAISAKAGDYLGTILTTGDLNVQHVFEASR